MDQFWTQTREHMPFVISTTFPLNQYTYACNLLDEALKDHLTFFLLKVLNKVHPHTMDRGFKENLSISTDCFVSLKTTP